MKGFRPSSSAGWPLAVSVTLNKQRRPIMKPSSAGNLYYSIDFNGFVISKLMKKIKL